MTKQSMGRAAMPVLVAALGLMVGSRASAAQRAREVPANTVVRVELDEKLSTRTARHGDRFTATVTGEDRSGFPEGTRFDGTVTEARRPTKSQPGVLNVRFDRAVFPGGGAVPLSGSLAGLEDDDVRRTSNGRLESRSGGGSKFEVKWVGYGAGAGAVLSTIFGGNLLKGALLGALGGAVYSYINKDKGHKGYSEVDLARGAEFGIRLNNRLVFNDSPRYRYAAYERDRHEPEYRGDRDYRDDRDYDGRDDRYGRDDRDERDRDERDRDERYDDRDERDRYYRDRQPAH
jgi:hypothetical protein